MLLDKALRLKFNRLKRKLKLKKISKRKFKRPK